MKRICAIIRPERTSQVRDALVTAGAGGMTLTQVQGMGSQHGFTEYYRGTEVLVQVLPKTRVEVVARDEDVDRLIAAIVKAARTGEPGDGKVFVTPVEQVIRIRNGKTGENAVVPEEL